MTTGCCCRSCAVHTNPHVVIGTNSKLNKWINKSKLHLSDVTLLAYDEADLMLQVCQCNRNRVMRCAVLCHVLLCRPVLSYIVLKFPVPHGTRLCCTVLGFLSHVGLCCTVLCCTPGLLYWQPLAVMTHQATMCLTIVHCADKCSAVACRNMMYACRRQR